MTLAACSGDGGSSSSTNTENTDAPSSTGDVHVCELLTPPEVAAAVGNPVEGGLPDVGNTCNWSSDDGYDASVRLLAGPSQEQCVAALEAADFYTEANGFGNKAFTFSGTELGGTAGVVVCVEQGQLEVSVYGSGDVPDEEHLRTAADDLARTVLERL
jgi:hypothetical protein